MFDYLKAVSLTGDQAIKAREKLCQGLSSYDKDRIIRGCRAVENVACLKELTASIIGMVKEVLPQIVACSANYAQVHKLIISQGRFISDQDIECKNMVCVVGDTVADSLGSDGKPGRYIRIEDNLFKVIGVLKRHDIKTAKLSVISIRDYNELIFLPLGVETINRIITL